MNTISITGQPDRVRILRYATLLIIVTNVIFNLLSITLFANPSVEEVINSYPIFFAPAGYSFSIWIVHLLFIIYAVLEITPDKKNMASLDRLALPLIITNIFELCWQYSFIRGQLNIGMIFLIGMLLSACLLYVKAQNYFDLLTIGMRWRIPFNLYLAWTSLITISSTASWLLSIHWSMAGMNESSWTIILILFSGLLGALMAFGKQDMIYAMIMAWANLSLGIKFHHQSQSISVAAFAVGLFLIWCALVSLVQSSGVIQKSPTSV
jgi:benzodiazapine receptor